MKTSRITFLLFGFSFFITSCTLFKPKYGCPSNGRNVGAERVLDMSKKEQRKVGKFRAGKKF